jgi:signal transduction histidine kinase
LVLAFFAVSTLTNSRDAIHQAKVLSDAETPAASIIFTQRESLVYLVKYSEYLAGGVDRRTVQIARALLTQRLNVIDAEGSSVGARIDPAFISALRNSDQILASGSQGILPIGQRPAMVARATPVINQLDMSARSLIVSYQHAVDQQIQALALSHERSARRNLALLLASIALLALLFLWVGFTTRSHYRRTRQIIRNESLALSEVRAELMATQSSLVKMQSLNEAKNEFIATVNHELRTPLTSITGYIDLIRSRISRGSTGDEIAPMVEVLDRNAGALLGLVESMLSLSRLESTDFQSDFHKVDLYENCANALFILEPELTRAGITIQLSGANDLYLIDGNYAQITQLFINIISNAIKFSPAGSQISISFTAHAGQINIAITDQGMGIPDEDISHLFTRFFRAKNAVAEQKPGTGLGLAIVQKIAFLHGGDIHVKSTVGVGTTVELEFPEAISTTDELVARRRIPVLQRSLNRITAATLSEFADTAHEIGGAIGFYGYGDAGEEILGFSRTIAYSEKTTEAEISRYKSEAIHILTDALEEAHAGIEGSVGA